MQAHGEQAVRAIAPGATIVRPADVFGPEDKFLNFFARMYGLFPRVPLVEGGTARVQPLYVNDLAAAIFKIAMVRGAQTCTQNACDVIRRARLCLLVK